MKLSVLDQSVIRMGETANQAFEKTTKLAMLTDELGYTRFWVAEHHNTNGLAGTSPEVLLAHLAAHTKRIRVGSGGVLLPQYSPFKVAENFKVLEALYPGRIDLGVGRSPGGSPVTRLALTDGIRKSLNEFPRQVRDLQSFLTNEISNDHPFHQVKAYPQSYTMPEMWMLGVRQTGAMLAAEYGTSFTYGHFITPVNGRQAINQYKDHFQPSAFLKTPKVNVCIFVVCAPTKEKAEEIALAQDLWLLAVERGGDTRIVSNDEARNYQASKAELVKMKQNRKRMIVGDPEYVREQLLLLSETYGVDEFMIINNVYDFEDKLYTYRALAEMFL
ncbi:LLM class flavin-dependent oxidoreductase [Metabacillus niabensis]|uniref:Luciferase family oxidoreductase group 1 n=1 Tax=Metabacillus niabensis TaxID=324854 RepID=A0ABT9Z265_9BACI|nr:LLM class flavin-dependent oxidoreductase [Metabacillus niabensis]MDQ0225380.1 luciferase family oxidoreductase group 1 [Metabacillus niabensis]